MIKIYLPYNVGQFLNFALSYYIVALKPGKGSSSVVKGNRIVISLIICTSGVGCFGWGKGMMR